ncbi:unnamed protein product [Closterium sp. NIES-64]|nr:unnamed protein product [Closterium sp. NIES-64]
MAHKRFKTSWESSFPWLILTRDDVGFPILRCSTCLEHGAEGAKTAYGKGGSGGRDMQKASIRTHQRSTAHQDAHAEMKAKESRKLRQALLSEFEGLDRSTLHIITALKTTVYICKSEAPITSYVGTIKFMADLGVPNLPLDSKGNYFSETIEVRYVDCEDRFGNEQSPLLCAFLKKHGNPDHREVTVKGVDQNGDAAEHKFVLHERKIPGHTTGGDYYSCKAVCQEFAKACVERLEFRLEDLNDLAGSKLFRPSCYPDDNAQRMKKCREWLGMLDHMFHRRLPARRVPVTFASPVAFTSPPSPSLPPLFRCLHFLLPSPSLPPPVAFTSPSRRLHFPLSSPSIPPPVAFISPSRRLHFPLPLPSFPPPVAFTSPSRRLHFPLPSPSLPPPVTLASPPVTFTSPPIAFHSLLLNLFPLLTLFPPAHSPSPCSLSSPLLTLFPPAHSLPPSSISSPLLTRFPPPQSLPPCSLSSPLLTLFPPAHSLPPCSLASPLLNLFPPAHSLHPSSFSFPLLTPLVLTPLSPFLTHFPPSRSLTPSARSCFPKSCLYSLSPPLLTLFPPCSLSFLLLTLFPPFSLSFPLHALFPSLPPVAPLRLALVPSQSPSLSPPVALVFPVALPSTPRCPRHPSLLPSHLAHLSRPLSNPHIHPSLHPCFLVSPALLPPILRLAPPIPFPSSPQPLPCSPPSPSLLSPFPFPASPRPLPSFPRPPPSIPPSASLLTPIPFPAPPHPLPCFPLSPSLLPPIAFPAHPCSLCFTLAPSPSSLLSLFPLAHSLYFCSLCSPLLPLFPSVQSVPRCFFSSPLLIPFTVFPPSLTPIPPNAVTERGGAEWSGAERGGAEWGGAGRNGVRRIGEMRDGEMRDEEMRDGEVWDGEERAGEERDGEVRDEEVRDGEMREGEMRNGEMRNGEIRKGVMNERACDGRVLLTTHPPTPHAMGRDERVGGMGREAMVNRGNVMGRGVMTTWREEERREVGGKAKRGRWEGKRGRQWRWATVAVGDGGEKRGRRWGEAWATVGGSVGDGGGKRGRWWGEAGATVEGSVGDGGGNRGRRWGEGWVTVGGSVGDGGGKHGRRWGKRG